MEYNSNNISITLTFIFWILSELCQAGVSMPNVRVLIVTGQAPRDGHLRLFRSANTRGLIPQLVTIGKNDTELEKIVDSIDQISAELTDLLIVTASDSMVMTKEKALLIHEIAKVILAGQGTVVIPFASNYSTNATSAFDEEIEQVFAQLKPFYKPPKQTPQIKTAEEWEISAPLYAKYRSLLAKKALTNKRNGRIFSAKFCVFAGATPAVKQLFQQYLSENITKANATLNRLCLKSMVDGSFRKQFGVVLDWHSEVFKLGHLVDQDSIGVFKVADGSRVVFSSEAEFAPMTLGRPSEMPYFLSNLMTGEIGIVKPCEKCPEKRPEGSLNDLFLDKEDYPTVHIVVARKTQIHSYEDFMKAIDSLNFPKSKIYLTFIISENKGEEGLMNNIKKHFEGKSYASFTGLSAPDVPAAYLYAELWERSRDVQTDYVMMLDPEAILTNPDALKELIRTNKRFIGPMLLSKNGDWNFRSEVNGDTLVDDVLTNYILNRREDESVQGKGVLQVPYIFGALLIKRNILRAIPSPFDIEEWCFETLDKPDCNISYYPQWKQPEKTFWGILSRNLVKMGVILHLTNEVDFGYMQLPTISQNLKE